MEWWDAWTPLWRLTVWKSLFSSLLDLLCPGQQSETRLGSSGVKQEAGVSRAIQCSGHWSPRPEPAPSSAATPGLTGSRSCSSRRDQGLGFLQILRRRLWLAGAKPWHLFTLPWCFPLCADVTKAIA